MAFEGVNERVIEQVISPAQATIIENYFIEREFELVRRKGSKKLAQVSSNTSASKILKQWTETLIILGYGTTLAVFNINDNTINNIKTDFSANVTDGLRWGDNFYSCNGRLGDRIYETTLPTLAYKTQTVNFTVGLVVTGGTSGATATIIADSDSGATGTLTLDNINGVFQADEALTDSGTGAAVVTSAVNYSNTSEISTAPKCESLNVYDKSLHAISTNQNKYRTVASKQNDFTKWATHSVNYDGQTGNFTVGSTVTGGTSGVTGIIEEDTDAGATGTLRLAEVTVNGKFLDNEAITDAATGAAVANGDSFLNLTREDPYIVDWERAGQAKDMGNLQNSVSGSESFGDIGVIFYKEEIYAFYNELRDVGGTLTKTQKEFKVEPNSGGGERGVLSTSFGILFGNKNGLSLLKNNGSIKNLTEFVSDENIQEFDVTDMDWVHIPEREVVIATIRKNAQVNNFGYWFSTKTMGGSDKPLFGTITGWVINRFLLIGRTVYGASSTSPKVVELLPDNIYDDEGGTVYYTYKQPLNAGQLETVKDILRQDIGAELSSLHNIRFQILGLNELETTEDETGIDYSVTGGGVVGGMAAYGESAYGEVGYGDSEVASNTKYVEKPGFKKAYGYKNYIVKITGNDQLPQKWRYISIHIQEGRLQRQSPMTDFS
jgi:hypothetical protein